MYKYILYIQRLAKVFILFFLLCCCLVLNYFKFPFFHINLYSIHHNDKAKKNETKKKHL